MVPLDVVDHLHDGPVPAEGVQDHGPRGLHDREPLPIRALPRREFPEQRMPRIRKNAQGTGRYGLTIGFAYSLEHSIVPIIRLEQSAHGVRRVRRHQQHLLARVQGLERRPVEFPRNRDSTLVGLVVGWIDPYGPAVLAVMPLRISSQMQVDARRHLFPLQKVGNGHVDVVFRLALQGFAGKVRHFHMRVELLVFAPAEFLKFRQRNKIAAEVRPTDRR